MSLPCHFSRREFLGLFGAGGLALAVPAHPATGRTAQTGEGLSASAWLHIGTTDLVTIFVDRTEMGQGVWTALPMLVAEELECRFGQLRVLPAPVARVYRNPLPAREVMAGIIGGEPAGDSVTAWFLDRLAWHASRQMTGSSSSVRNAFLPLRLAGAVARNLLLEAAGRDWHIPARDLVASDGVISSRDGTRRARYGELATAAAGITPGENPPLKSGSRWKIIGRPLPRVDVPAKVRGTARHGLDIRLPGMLSGVVAMPPVPGGSLSMLDVRSVENFPGLVTVLVLPGRDGVVVVAERTWQAMKAMEALPLVWEDGPNGTFDSRTLMEEMARAADRPGRVIEERGDPVRVMKEADRRIAAEYRQPFLAHAAIEPVNATAWLGRNGILELWIGTQAQEEAAAAAAAAAGIDPGQVVLHTLFMGGGFGRGLETRIAGQAAFVASRLHRPVRILWPREQDFANDAFRPPQFARLEASLTAAGRITGMAWRIAGPSARRRRFPLLAMTGLDRSPVDGATGFPYAAIDHFRLEHVGVTTDIPLGSWRSIGHSLNAFARESFIDEIAWATGQDPVTLRRELLRGGEPRALAVLDRVTTETGWGRPLDAGQAQGVALHASFGTLVACVVRVRGRTLAELAVEQIDLAVDCGQVIHPDILVAQIGGGALFGLTAALYGEVVIRNGRSLVRRFRDCPLLSARDCPEVRVHIVHSNLPPGGAGEPGTPPAIPALANAIHRATGQRIRTLPVHGSTVRDSAAGQSGQE